MNPNLTENSKRSKYTIQPIFYQYRQRHYGGINLTPPKNFNKNKSKQKNKDYQEDRQYFTNLYSMNHNRQNNNRVQQQSSNITPQNSQKTPIEYLSQSQYQNNRQNYNFQNQRQQYQIQSIPLSLIQPSYPPIRQKPFQQIKQFKGNQLRIMINRKNKHIINRQSIYNTGEIPLSNFKSIQKSIKRENDSQVQYYQNIREKRSNTEYVQINFSKHQQPSPSKKKKQKLSVISTSENKEGISSSVQKQKPRSIVKNKKSIANIIMLDNQEIAQQNGIDSRMN